MVVAEELPAQIRVVVAGVYLSHPRPFGVDVLRRSDDRQSPGGSRQGSFENAMHGVP
jgi:hypothetical protein